MEGYENGNGSNSDYREVVQKVAPGNSRSNVSVEIRSPLVRLSNDPPLGGHVGVTLGVSGESGEP